MRIASTRAAVITVIITQPGTSPRTRAARAATAAVTNAYARIVVLPVVRPLRSSGERDDAHLVEIKPLRRRTAGRRVSRLAGATSRLRGCRRCSEHGEDDYNQHLQGQHVVKPREPWDLSGHEYLPQRQNCWQGRRKLWPGTRRSFTSD